MIVYMKGALWDRQPILACFVWSYFSDFFVVLELDPMKMIVMF